MNKCSVFVRKQNNIAIICNNMYVTRYYYVGTTKTLGWNIQNSSLFFLYLSFFFIFFGNISCLSFQQIKKKLSRGKEQWGLVFNAFKNISWLYKFTCPSKSLSHVLLVIKRFQQSSIKNHILPHQGCEDKG